MVRARPEVVKEWAISVNDKRLLIEVGLPRAIEPFFEADIQERTDPAARLPGLGGMYKIGWDKGRNIAVAGANGAVYAVDQGGKAPGTFVNTSLSCLLDFLYQVGKQRVDVSDMTDAQAEAAVHELKSALERVDPQAFRDISFWWALVFEQLETGMY